MNRRQFFDRHARHWDEERPKDMAPRLERVLEEANLRGGQQVLDVGTGTGVLIPRRVPRIGDTGAVVALDISAEMLEVARGKGFPANVTFLEADMQDAPALEDESFDRVICNAAFPHFPDRRAALAEMIRVLRPGGILIISHPIGREAVNALHCDQGDVVAEDRVPPAAEMQALLEEAGLTEVRVIDEPEFYLAAGRRPG